MREETGQDGLDLLMSEARYWESDGLGNVTKIKVIVGYDELDSLVMQLKQIPSFFETASRQALLGGIEFEFVRPSVGKSGAP